MRQNSISIQIIDLMKKIMFRVQVVELQSKDKLANFSLNGKIGALNSRHFGLTWQEKHRCDW